MTLSVEILPDSPGDDRHQIDMWLFS